MAKEEVKAEINKTLRGWRCLFINFSFIAGMTTKKTQIMLGKREESEGGDASSLMPSIIRAFRMSVIIPISIFLSRTLGLRFIA